MTPAQLVDERLDELSVEAPSGGRSDVNRDVYIDVLRTVMTALVVFAHTAMTYGGTGSWFYYEVPNSASRSSELLTMFVITSSAVLLGFFFFLAGYFTPGSLGRKGYRRFIADRCVRLGIPLLMFGFLLGPLTVSVVGAIRGRSIVDTIRALWHNRNFIDGPMWFAQALLIFSLTYCLVQYCLRRWGGAGEPGRVEARPLPEAWVWVVSALVTGAAALLLRQVFPMGRVVFGLSLGNFAAFIALFLLGILAWRRDWIRQLSWRQARVSVIAMLVAWPVLPLGLAVYVMTGRRGDGLRGLMWPNVLLSFWEPLIGLGCIAGGLLLFRARFNKPSALWTWLGRRAFAVYMVHALTLVCVCLALRDWHAPAMVKFAVAGSLGCVVSWLAADILIRIPGLRRII